MEYAQRKEQVLKAAAAVFAARGFHRASVREIASRAGMSLAGLYYYFPGKTDLLGHIISTTFDVLLTKLDDALSGVSNPRERVQAFIQNHLDFFVSHMDAMKVISRESEFLTGESQAIVASKKRQYYFRCIEILRELGEARWSEEDLRVAALVLFGMINWIYTWYRSERDGDAERLANQMTHLFLDGFLKSATVERDEVTPGDVLTAPTLANSAGAPALDPPTRPEPVTEPSEHRSPPGSQPSDQSHGTPATAESFEQLVERCREIVTTPVGDIAAAWKASHPDGKAVGCYPVYTPVELIHAGGALPLAVLGGGNQIEIAHADSRFQSFICSIVKSTLELGLTGKLQTLDAMLFHSICDPARNLASVFKRNFPNIMVEYLHLPQNFSSPRAEEYLLAEYERVRSSLQALVGRTITDQDLLLSTGLYNRARALIRSLYEVRRTGPERFSAAECYLLMRAGTVLSVEEHITLLDSARAALQQRAAKPKDRIRVVLEGSFCEQPPLELIEGLEEAGCYLLDDDFLLGWRWFDSDVPLDGEPLRGLAQAYLNGSVYSGVKHDLREPKAKHLLGKVRELKADAVVILVAKFCEPALFDYALYRKALDEAGIPHLFLEFEEKMWVFDRIRSEVETFVESMLFD